MSVRISRSFAGRAKKKIWDPAYGSGGLVTSQKRLAWESTGTYGLEYVEVDEYGNNSGGMGKVNMSQGCMDTAGFRQEGVTVSHYGYGRFLGSRKYTNF